VVVAARLLFDQNPDVMTQAREWVQIGSQPFGLALVLQSFSDGGSEAALHESTDEPGLVPTVQPLRPLFEAPFFLFVKHYGSSC
jgi:hypothetical protein